jgi:hypothetical protein
MGQLEPRGSDAPLRQAQVVVIAAELDGECEWLMTNGVPVLRSWM